MRDQKVMRVVMRNKEYFSYGLIIIIILIFCYFQTVGPVKLP